MDIQTLFNFGLSAVSGILGWLAKELWTAVKELKDDLAKLREELPKTYSPKQDVKEGFKEIKDMLSTISLKLDNKVDK